MNTRPRTYQGTHKGRPYEGKREKQKTNKQGRSPQTHQQINGALAPLANQQLTINHSEPDVASIGLLPAKPTPANRRPPPAGGRISMLPSGDFCPELLGAKAPFIR